MTEYEFAANRQPLASSDNQPTDKLSYWEAFRNHRGILTNFIKRQSPPFSDSLCVLGAGFCNDLDLNELAANFQQLTLVDIAKKDLSLGLRQQDLSESESLKIVGDYDVTGVHDLFLKFQESQERSDLESLVTEMESFHPSGLGVFDSVASTCLLSQLMFHAYESVTEGHERFVEILQKVRLQHIRVMLDLIKPGGVGFLFTDFVSSESLPELFTTRNLKETVENAIAERNFLHGLNPTMVARVFEEPEVKSELKNIKVTDPWRWVLPERIYACFGIIFEKR
ncbi:MAG: hypothetical protein AAGA30_08445 [Planctomycetota bacterium]